MIGWYCDVTLGGAYVKLFKDSHLEHNGRRVELPQGRNLLYVRISPDGRRFAGCGHLPPVEDRALEYDSQTETWTDHGPAHSVLYDLHGNLHPRVGSPRWRYVDASGRLVDTDETNFDPALRIWQYTRLGDLIIGQGGKGPKGEDPLIAIFEGKRKLLQDGACRFINAYRDMNDVAIACVREDQKVSLIRHLTLDDIRNAPDLEAEAPPISIGDVNVSPLGKRWIAPYFSHSGPAPDREGYGDTSDHCGNAIWTYEPERIAGYGLPFISTRRSDHDLCVAHYTDHAHVAGLGERVREVLNWRNVPVVAYLDSRDWPRERPSWVTGRVWPAVQAYRDPGESIDAFEQSVEKTLERVHDYRQPFALVPAFFTRNGHVPVAEILQCMPLYDRWLREFDIRVILPFADRRPTGMEQHREFRAWAKAFANACERPTRNDFWTPDGGPEPKVCPCCHRPL